MKPKIAVLISGRATCWENCLLPILNNSIDYDIDLFMSINNENENCKYFIIMKEKMSKYLKNIYIKKYIVPEDFINTSTHEYTVKQVVNDKLVPFNILSMWFNYKNSFKMACEYEKRHNFEYDFFMTFRSDIIINKIPLFRNIRENVLYSINQPCQFISLGIYKEPIISPEWVYSKKNTMSQYLETYDFIIQQSKNDMNYICHYESNVTDNCISKNMNIIRIPNIQYFVDANRRRFDNWEILKDTRKYNIKNKDKNYIDIELIDENLLLVQQIKS